VLLRRRRGLSGPRSFSVFGEQELVCAGAEHQCGVAAASMLGWVGAGFKAADVGDVEASGVREGVSRFFFFVASAAGIVSTGK
jgi:hypothetical protein